MPSYHPPFLQDADAVGVADGREAVRDEDRRRLPGRGQDALEDLGLAAHVELRGRLVEQHNGRTLPNGGERPRERDALPLAAGEIGAAGVAARQDGVQIGEAEIFERILAATRQTTTILISHRFSTVRHADRICVLEGGRVVELGTHDELIAAGGRYRTMFDLQASRFGSTDGEGGDEEGIELDVLT